MHVSHPSADHYCCECSGHMDFAMVLLVLEMQSVTTILLGIFEESGKAVWCCSGGHLETTHCGGLIY